MAYVIKTKVQDTSAAVFTFTRQKTMYGGKRIAAGDTIFLFASEISGGGGLFARGVVTAAEAVPTRLGILRQTPRVTISVSRSALALRPLGRAELKAFKNWGDGHPGTELNFKLCRQATDKVAGISDATAEWLAAWF